MVVDRFFVWVADATVDQRVRAVDPLVRAFTAETVTEADRESLEAALTLMSEDPEITVRMALAEALCDTDLAPRHILQTLLWDESPVAEIVAARSEILIDAELIEAAGSGDDAVRFALARRRRVGPGLAAALAEAGDRRAVVALLANPDADVGAAALERAVERFGEFADVREALMARPHVPITVRHRVLEKLAEAMAGIVTVGRFAQGDRAETLTRDAKDRATVALAADAGDAEATVLVDHLRHTGQLTTRLILRAACIGDLRFVEEALAALAGVPSRRVAALVAEGRDGAFRALYARAGMPERAYPAFAAALEVHRDLLRETGGWDGRAGDRARFSRRLVERVLTRWTAVDRRDGDDLLALLRRFAADAAREQARALIAERTQAAALALEAPPPAPSLEAEIAVELRATFAAPAVVARPQDRIVRPEVGGIAFESAVAAAAAAEVERLRVVATPVETAAEPIVVAPPIEPDDLDEPVGLFAHVDLDDVPQEWLAEIAESGPASAFFADELRGGIAA